MNAGKHIFKDSSRNWTKTMHFKILNINFLEEKSGKNPAKIFETGTGYLCRISGRNRIQPDIRSVPSLSRTFVQRPLVQLIFTLTKLLLIYSRQ